MDAGVAFRCRAPQCARALPRQVNFCPYCGHAQRTPNASAKTEGAHSAVPEAIQATGALSALGAANPAPGQSSIPARPPEPVPESRRSPAPQPLPPGRPASASGPASAQQPQPPRPAASAPPAQQARTHGAAAVGGVPKQHVSVPNPVQWGRIVVIAVAVGMSVWFIAKPSAGRKTEERVLAAIALAESCKFDQARKALEDLRSAQATSNQLDRLQAAVSKAIPACAGSAVPPKSAPKPAPKARAKTNPTQSTRNLLAEGQRHIDAADYQGAIDKMEVCTTMIDPASLSCLAMQRKAQALQAALKSCLANGKEWIGGHCS